MRGPLEPVRFLRRFAFLALTCEALFFLFFADGSIFRVYLEIHAYAVSFLLQALGFEVEVRSTTLLVGDSYFEVARGCDVTRPILLLAAAIVAFRAPVSSKLRAILFGTMLLLAANLVRIVSLILLKHSPSLVFESLHLALWPLVLLLLILWFWVTWARRQVAVPLDGLRLPADS